MTALPAKLTTPFVDAGAVALKLMLDLTVYVEQPTVGELDWLCDFYQRLCPTKHWLAFQITELLSWSSVHSPELTSQGRRAANQGVHRPYIEPTRGRIRNGRAFDVMFWDRLKIDDPDGSWSFSCRRILRRSSGLHAFARLLVPLETDLAVLREAAGAIADQVAFSSGHAGLVFVYEPWHKHRALDEAYARAKRYWCVDVEDLNASLPLMREHVKCVNWLTLIGNRLAVRVEDGIAELARQKVPGVAFDRRHHGVIIVAGDDVAAGDRNVNAPEIDVYARIARALEPLFPTDHPSFASARFKDPGATIGWVRRFIDPSGW